MNRFAFALALSLALPSLAKAELDSTLCTTRNGQDTILIATFFEGTFADVVEQGSLPAKASMRFIRKNGSPVTEIGLPMTGTIQNSTKGPYYDVKAGKISLFISAAASDSPTELRAEGVDAVMEFICL